MTKIYTSTIGNKLKTNKTQFDIVKSKLNIINMQNFTPTFKIFKYLLVRLPFLTSILYIVDDQSSRFDGQTKVVDINAFDIEAFNVGSRYQITMKILYLGSHGRVASWNDNVVTSA